MDITQLILDDHHEQRRRFALLEQIDSADVAALSDIWTRLAVFLEVHAAAEEEIFYPELVRLALAPRPLASAEPETVDAIYDHNEIRDAIAAVRPHRVGSPEWRAAVAAVNVANGDHMAEEEREGLTDFRRRVSLPVRHALAVRFVTFEARNFAGVRPTDKDPEQYVREQEAAARSGLQDGSLLGSPAAGTDSAGEADESPLADEPAPDGSPPTQDAPGVGSPGSPGSLGIGALKHSAP